jgi:hypothetical protein
MKGPRLRGSSAGTIIRGQEPEADFAGDAQAARAPFAGSAPLGAPAASASIVAPAPLLSPPNPPANPPTAEAGGPWQSSIARNRAANRVISPADVASTAGLAANGGRPAGASGTSSGGRSSIARNRLEREGEAAPAYEYPDIHADPAELYHERFGVEKEHDRFLFPWLMNLIFEDRWLLAERDPARALRSQLRRRLKIDIRDPDPDTANFPNGAYTVPKGRAYIENSPVGFYGGSKSMPSLYQWDFLLRYGLTDNLEFRIFSNGLSVRGKPNPTVGFQPLAFDFKANFWEENSRYFIPAMGLEVFIQTTFGSPAFNGGTQPSMNILFDQSLPLEIGFEYNFGITGVQNAQGEIVYQFSYQWSFQRQVVKDFDVFVHGFYNAAALPRILTFRGTPEQERIPLVNVVGVGAIRTFTDRFAVFGSFNFGTTPGSPRTIALLGFAVAM